MVVDTTQNLIEGLARDLKPVGHLPPPGWRMAVWVLLALPALYVVFGQYPARPDLGYLLETNRFFLEFAGALITGLLALFAAFMLALPDRSNAWALLPVPAVLAWLMTMGGGCYQDYVRLGPEGLSMGVSLNCLQEIVTASLLMGLPLFFMLRHAARVRPVEVMLVAGLGLASLASAILMFFHGLETAMTVLVWHGGATLAVMAVALILRKPIFGLAFRLSA